MAGQITQRVRAWLPKRFRQWIMRATRWPRVGHVQFGGLRRTTPISRVFGGDRGLPMDRWYIEQFLSAHSSDIRGRVLEIGDNVYTLRYGSAVVQSDILYHAEGNPKATLVADLSQAVGSDQLPSGAFDCIVCTQTLHMIFEVRTTLRNLASMLKEGGVLLLTLPGISQIDPVGMEDWGDYWRFTTLSTRRLLEEVFPPSHLAITSHGNVLSAIAFLHGLAADELETDELTHDDQNYQLLITVRAVKGGAGS